MSASHTMGVSEGKRPTMDLHEGRHTQWQEMADRLAALNREIIALSTHLQALTLPSPETPDTKLSIHDAAQRLREVDRQRQRYLEWQQRQLTIAAQIERYDQQIRKLNAHLGRLQCMRRVAVAQLNHEATQPPAWVDDELSGGGCDEQ